ncbi:MAG: hypothetical protein PVG14_19610 [Anaerolineales bacterium]
MMPSSALGFLIRRMLASVREFMAGAALSWTAPPYILKRRRETENLFILLTLLNYWGTSPLLPQHRLLILPYVVPQILYWRRRLSLWDDALETADLKHIGH